jgi:hypothetical protein
MFDISGIMAKPWLEAGYQCWTLDTQHPPAYATGGVTTEGRLHKVHHDLTKPWLCPIPRERIAFAFAFPPCDHVAVSGARWFQGKGLRRLALSIELFATAAEFCEWTGAPYGIENPVSNISSHWRKPDHYFSPEQYTGFCVEDNYTKKTCLWTGGGLRDAGAQSGARAAATGRPYLQMPARPRTPQHPQRHAGRLCHGRVHGKPA